MLAAKAVYEGLITVLGKTVKEEYVDFGFASHFSLLATSSACVFDMIAKLIGVGLRYFSSLSSA